MTLFIGLTGSIGMGKSTTTQMFRDAGITIYDADATVHKLYEGDAVDQIEAAFPGTKKAGRIDRKKLSESVVGNEAAMKRLEKIIHPLVRREEQKFREQTTATNESFAILDIPLLFETNSEERVDGIIVVTAPSEIQRTRVLERPEMTEEKFQSILARQTPDAVKQSKADFIVDTSKGLDAARQKVSEIIEVVSTGQWVPKKQPRNHRSDA